MVEPVHKFLTENEGIKNLGKKFSPGYEEPFCGCCGSWDDCLLSCFCSPCVSTSTKIQLDNRESTWFDFLCCAGAYQTRQTNRAQNSIAYDPTMDCLASCLCGPCIVSQEARELAKKKGGKPEFLKLPK